MNTQKNLDISVLLDYYSPMLTEKQRNVIELYYNEDLSLSEIAEHEKITRQGVRDSIKRGEMSLLEMEQKFHLAEKSSRFYRMIDEITVIASEIKEECISGRSIRNVIKRAERVAEIANENKDLF